MRNGDVVEREAPDNQPTFPARLTVSDMLLLDQVDADGAVISHKETGKRLRLSHPLYRLITKFCNPATVEEAIPASDLVQVRRLIERLINYGFLRYLDEDPISRNTAILVRPSVYTLFQSPRWSVGSRVPDITVVGIPYDGGDVASGARDAPDAIRERSAHIPYSLDLASLEPTGWFDVEAQEHYLGGVTLADWGNITVRRGESPKILFHRIELASSTIQREGALPLFIGGDHSISFPIIKGLGEEKVTVLWFDAHTDFGELSSDSEPSHKNVLRAIAALPNVERVCILGHRGYTMVNKAHLWPTIHPKLRIFTARALISEMSICIPDIVEDGMHCYVSVDINVLDPVHAPATASPIPGGLAPNQLKELFRGIGKRARIVGMDITEMNPTMERGILTATQAMQLLIVGAGVAMWNRKFTGSA